MSALPAPDVSDERYMAVLTTLSRHGVRLPPERLAPLVADILSAVGAPMSRHDVPDPDLRCVNWPDCHGAGLRDGAHRLCKSCQRRRSTDEWTPNPDYAKQEAVRRKNPAPGRRVCTHCRESLPLARFGTNVKNGKRTPKVACRKCLNDAQRNRYITARKMEGVLNAARLEFVADDDVAGLRCLDCHEMIVAGDEVVAETGLRHLACGEAS